MVMLFTIDCINCKRLENKLIEANISYTVCKDKEVMRAKGFITLPMLVVDGQTMNFKEAVKWVNTKRGAM